jgi:GT2 family glycosyltransferase
MEDNLDVTIERIRSSGLFDSDYFLAIYPDVAAAMLDPVSHYVQYGAAEGRRPNDVFDAVTYNVLVMDEPASNLSSFLHYISLSPDVRAAHDDALADATPVMIEAAIAVARSPAFDVDYYLTQFEPGKRPAIPALHYIDKGSKAGLRPNPAFDPAFYRRTYLDEANDEIEPLIHYSSTGTFDGRKTSHLGVSTGSPYSAADVAAILESGLFDETYYRATVPVLPFGADPLLHYLNIGSLYHVRPSEAFDPIFYFATVPSSRSPDLPVLVHYLREGKTAGHAISQVGRYHWLGQPLSGEDDVHIERLHAASFGFRHGISNDDSGPMVRPSAIAELAQHTPCGLQSAVPAVSIIIPVYGQLSVVLGCLDSISRHKSKYDFEVLLFDDASPAEMGIGALADIPWLSYVHGEHNRGFIGACNQAVILAQGKYIVLLNSDTRVCDGWLDELVDTFMAQPDAGFVGSKLYNGDGSLQEAGAIVWQDGSAWNYGRNDRPNRAEYCYARQVDYCSGAAIAVPRTLWNNLGGFDTHFSPAYYEDVDLAYRVRAANRQVWMQPLARVIHYEGMTHGRDETKGIKASQVVNAKKFYERWRETLCDHGVNGNQPLRASNRAHQKWMLALDAETPAPKRDAGSVMTVKLLQLYQRLGWHVTFVPIHNPNFHTDYTPDLQRAGIEVLNHSDLIEVLRSRDGMYEAVLAFRVTVLQNLIDRIRAVDPAILVLFHDIDLHFLRMEREAILKNCRISARKADIMKTVELELTMKVDCTIVPSTVEKDILREEAGIDNVVVYSYTADIVPSNAGLANRRDLVFVGGFRHMPNIDAVHFFLKDVWPRLKNRLPSDVKFYIIGSDAPESITALADDRVIFTGFLDDLGPRLECCRIFVAPLRYGAGLKGKIVTSLSYGIPCVASAIAIEGMALEPEKHVIEANDAKAFISQITRVYKDEALWIRLRQSGHAFVKEEYSWQTGMDVARDILEVAENSWHSRQLSERNTRLAETRNIRQ